MICNQCETVVHCTKHGCIPKQPVPMAHIVGEIDHTGKVWKPAQPAVPDEITDNSESPEYIQGWNDCRALMLGKGK